LNWSHLKATLWLRWRILINRVRRAGKLSSTIFGLLIFLGVSLSLGLFALALLIGLEVLHSAEALDLMVAWIGLALAFLFFWMVGLVTDLQRSDAMSFKNLLHLPVSLGWVFLYNYLSSFVSISVAIFLPAMIGLSLAMVIVLGPEMLMSVPLVLGFLGMITALTYQLRGWLARLMENKRRGRNIVAAITVVFVLLLQTPNLINLSRLGSSDDEHDAVLVEEVEGEAPPESGTDGSTAQTDPEAQAQKAEEVIAAHKAKRAKERADVDRIASLAAIAIPVGWLPYGVRAAFDGRWLISALCALGMLSIATWSLRRSYRTTLASIVGLGSGGVADESTPLVKAAQATTPPPVRGLMVQRRLPFAGERETGIAFASLRSLLRAPEAKMLLLSPVILLALFAFMLSTNPALDRMKAFAPMMSLGAIAMGLLSINQLIQNQFGLDREGFRAYVLSPVPRHQILVGKNLGTAPLGLIVGLIALIGLQFFVPTSVFHFLGACLQLVSAYMILCLFGNMLSILAPMRLREGGLKAANAKLKTVLTHVFSFLLIPLILSPLLIPYGVEFLLRGQSWARIVPIYLVLHALGLTAIFLFYRWMIQRQGELLQQREQLILEELTRD